MGEISEIFTKLWNKVSGGGGAMAFNMKITSNKIKLMAIA